MNIQRMTPEHVVVKAFGGSALVRWLIGASNVVAEITNDEGAEIVRMGCQPVAVGFPLRDVFRIKTNERISDGDKPNWQQFQPRF